VSSPRKVFISYSHDSAEHADRVLELADQLRVDGVEAILDQYEPHPPEGWPRWMDSKIEDADFILVICTERYFLRVKGKEAPGVGLGVRWESHLTYQYIYNSESNNSKFIPVVFEREDLKHIPTVLQAVTNYELDSEEGYLALYRRLTNQPEITKPELGQVRSLPARERKKDLFINKQGPSTAGTDNVENPTYTHVDMTITSLHQLPPPPRDFTGRRQEIEDLLNKLEQSGVSISGLQGMGGIGKTTLALKLAEQLSAKYPDAQFYLDLKGASSKPLTSAEIQAHVIRAYHPTTRLPEDEGALNGLYQSVLYGKRALLLLDNAEDSKQLEPLIPPPCCALIVTSRYHFTLPGLYAKRLDVLAEKDAEQLLLSIAPRIANQAGAMAKLCGYLPLALRLAATALAEKINIRVADYLNRLEDAQQRLSLVEASVSLSYELLNEQMQKLCRSLAVFPDTFDGEAAVAVWGIAEDDAQESLSSLVIRSLVEYNETTGRYRLHDLIRLYADSRLSQEESDDCQRRHSRHYLALLSETDLLYEKGGEAISRGLILFDQEVSNIEAGQAWAEKRSKEDEEAAELCSYYPLAGIYLLSLRKHSRENIRWTESALEAARLLKDRKAEAAHLTHLGVASKDIGENKQAIEYYEQALIIDREIGDQQGEGADLGNLGVAYKNLGENERAIEHYEQHLVIAREIGDRRGEGNALGNLGNAYADLGETRRAIEYHEQALIIDREIGDRRGEGADLGNLGLAYAHLGETKRAIEYYEQALIIGREIGDRRGEGNGLYCMSLALYKLGQNEQAISLAETALKIYEQIESPTAAKVRKALAEWREQS
jgi:tetratricopeptide (TPR) repeat protein